MVVMDTCVSELSDLLTNQHRGPAGPLFLCLNSYSICKFMPRGRLDKVDILARVYKMKTALYDGQYSDKSGDWHDGAHDALSKVLDAINEYS